MFPGRLDSTIATATPPHGFALTRLKPLPIRSGFARAPRRANGVVFFLQLLSVPTGPHFEAPRLPLVAPAAQHTPSANESNLSPKKTPFHSAPLHLRPQKKLLRPRASRPAEANTPFSSQLPSAFHPSPHDFAFFETFLLNLALPTDSENSNGVHPPFQRPALKSGVENHVGHSWKLRFLKPVPLVIYDAAVTS